MRAIDSYSDSEMDVLRLKGMLAGSKQLTCERCGHKTDAGAWIGFVYVGAECLTEDDKQYVESI